MKTSSFMQADILRMGALARACLTSGQRGKVLASFSQATYLVTDDDEILWIVMQDGPMHRRALKSSSPLSGLQADLPFSVQDQRLTIGADITFNMACASVWDAPRINPADTVGLFKIPERVQALFSILDLSYAEGFGNLIPDILRLSQCPSMYHQPELFDPIIASARPFVLDLMRATSEHPASRILRDADALIGLGAGLTPSGDDFVGGMLFCIKVLQDLFPNAIVFRRRPSLEPYRSRTHPISFTLLKDLADGHAIAPLHYLVHSILCGDPLELMRLPVLQLTRIGHSTGWDMLAGLFAGLLIMSRNAESDSSLVLAHSIGV